MLRALQLDILAGSAAQGRLSGTVKLNGTPRNLVEYRRLSCYVQQRDVLLETATVCAVTTAASVSGSTLLFYAGVRSVTDQCIASAAVSYAAQRKGAPCANGDARSGALLSPCPRRFLDVSLYTRSVFSSRVGDHGIIQ